jgi:serine O-acetyltransferase
MDEAEINPIPKGIIGKTIGVLLSARYSMPVLMRLSQYYYLKSTDVSNKIRKKIYNMLAFFLRRVNQVSNHFEHGVNPQVAAGVVFHHSGVCISSYAVIESGVHIYRNVTFGAKDGFAPHIKKEAKIGSHSVVLGRVTVGEKAIVAPGAVVVKDVPPGKIAAGVPARIIGNVTDERYNF